MNALTVEHASCIVVGSGIAGLSTALACGDCMLISKSALGDGSSRWAQGGIAAAIGADDSPAFHAADTQRVSGGLSDARVAAMVSAAAPDRVRWLRSIGAQFDLDETGQLALGREAGHGRRRIVHANGDATGAEIMRALVGAVLERPDIERRDNAFVLDLLRDDDRVLGVLTLGPDGRLAAIVSPSVVLATGGIGGLYEKTTNPPEVTADGLAMAARAGVVLRDPEFVQFHPTAFDASVDPLPLLTEALRGEGAQLLDHMGRRFMVDVHPDAELAPRDIVARENWHRGQTGPVHLDARMVGPDFEHRFPTVWSIAQQAGLDPRTDLLPVSPAQHFHMGGIATDDAGRTSLQGLYACGEAASSGLHGANRLASNSLLEGLVLGHRVAGAVTLGSIDQVLPVHACVPAGALELGTHSHTAIGSDAAAPAISELRRLMWRKVGLVRDGAGLREAQVELDRLGPRLVSDPTGRNLLDAARVLIEGALNRTESRGGHFRSDHPDPEPSSTSTFLQPPPAPTVVISLQREATPITA